MLFRLTLLSAALALPVVANASADESKYTLNFGQLVDACNRADSNWISFCDGYVQSLIDSYYSYQAFDDIKICLPAEVSRAQLAGAVADTGKALLEVEPIYSSRNAAMVALAILGRKYPCGD
ncbi:MAG: Rap1a/Tai family immunity protein [Hyphomonas sp.]